MAVLGSAGSPTAKAGMASMIARLTWSSRLFGTRRRVPRGARLTAVHEGHDEGRRDRLVENGVIEQDGRRLAAQFQHDALHGFRPVAHDRFANANRPGERDLGDIGITYQLCTDDIAA